MTLPCYVKVPRLWRVVCDGDCYHSWEQLHAADFDVGAAKEMVAKTMKLPAAFEAEKVLDSDFPHTRDCPQCSCGAIDARCN